MMCIMLEGCTLQNTHPDLIAYATVMHTAKIST